MENPRETYREDKPWGYFEKFTENETTTVKILTIHPYQSLSLQRHLHRDEWLRALSGNGSVAIGDQKIPFEPGKEYFIPRGTPHRVESGDAGAVYLEISFGDFDEADIIRLEDKYGRASS